MSRIAPTERLTLILLPGLLCDSGLWVHQTQSLADVAEIRVADLTGHTSLRDLATAVLAHAPERFALAGLSMGGYVAQEILRLAPERVVKLALLDTNARADTADQSARRRGLIELARSGSFASVMPGLLPNLIHPDRLGDAALTGAIIAMADRVGSEAFERQQTAIMHRSDGQSDLERVACPTLVLGGRQDALTPPKVLAEMVERLPNARLALIEDCGHLASMEQPQAVTALLRDWLIYA